MLTRRGYAVLGIALTGVVLAAFFGARALNAVVMPALVALAAGLVQVRLTDRPSVTRRVPDDGYVGERRTVRLSFERTTPFVGTVEDAVGPGLSADGNRREMTVGDKPVEYTVTLESRGEHSIGPLTVTARDVLGLVARTFSYRDADSLLVYPSVYELSGAGRAALSRALETDRPYGQQEYDRLREYERGDSLRDIHWKSSAKRPGEEFVVKEFTGVEADERTVEIVAEADEGRVDAMAEAAASVALFLLDEGCSVGVRVPNGAVPPGTGSAHRIDILRLLARAEAGRGDRPGESAVHVRAAAGSDDVLVSTEGRETKFSRLNRDGWAAGRRRTEGGVSADGGRTGVGR